jgi:hypothetical protein
MEQLILKQSAVEAIRKNPILYAQVASVLGLSCYSLPRILLINDPRLTQATILKLLKNHLKVAKDSDLLTVMEAA